VDWEHVRETDQVISTRYYGPRIGVSAMGSGLIPVVPCYPLLPPIRSFFSKHTAEVAKETLANEALVLQTRELSAAVVQYILNGK